jgi:hypothetical protein
VAHFFPHLTMALNFVPFSTFEVYINDNLLSASLEDAERQLTDPISHELIIILVFIAGRVWEADSIFHLLLLYLFHFTISKTILLI